MRSRENPKLKRQVEIFTKIIIRILFRTDIADALERMGLGSKRFQSRSRVSANDSKSVYSRVELKSSERIGDTVTNGGRSEFFALIAHTRQNRLFRRRRRI